MFPIYSVAELTYSTNGPNDGQNYATICTANGIAYEFGGLDTSLPVIETGYICSPYNESGTLEQEKALPSIHTLQPFHSHEVNEIYCSSCRCGLFGDA